MPRNTKERSVNIAPGRGTWIGRMVDRRWGGSRLTRKDIPACHILGKGQFRDSVPVRFPSIFRRMQQRVRAWISMAEPARYVTKNDDENPRPHGVLPPARLP